MKFILALCLSATSCVIASAPALAHRPYYSQIEPIQLANGEVGQVRLLHGDGIVFTDPVRALIVGAEGQLLARGPKAHSIVILCSDDHRCLIVDLWKERVYDPDPATFRQGPMQPAVKHGDVTNDWDLEAGDESWGFSVRKANAREFLAANLELARHSVFGLAVIAALSGIGALALVPFRLNHQSRLVRLLARTILLVVGSMVLLFFVILTFWFSMLAGLSFEIWLVPTVLGAGSVWLVAGISRWRAHRAAGA